MTRAKHHRPGRVQREESGRQLRRRSKREGRAIPRASEHATERREAREEDSSRPRQARRLHSRRRGAGTAASNGTEVIRAKHHRQDRAQREERKATKMTSQERRQGDSQSERVHARQSELSRRGAGNSQSEQAREREARGERGRRQPSTPSQASTLQTQRSGHAGHDRDRGRGHAQRPPAGRVRHRCARSECARRAAPRQCYRCGTCRGRRRPSSISRGQAREGTCAGGTGRSSASVLAEGGAKKISAYQSRTFNRTTEAGTAQGRRRTCSDARTPCRCIGT